MSSHTKLMTGYAPPFDSREDASRRVWESTCSRHSDLPCFGTRSIDADGVPRGVHVADVRLRVRATRRRPSSGFVHLGVRPEQNVGLYSINCAEWCVLESAMTRGLFSLRAVVRHVGPGRGSFHLQPRRARCSVRLSRVLADDVRVPERLPERETFGRLR